MNIFFFDGSSSANHSGWEKGEEVAPAPAKSENQPEKLLSCWRCGAPTDGESECAKCRSKIVSSDGEPIEPVQLNFAKVQSLGDVIEILSGLGLWVAKGSELHKKMRRFTDE